MAREGKARVLMPNEIRVLLKVAELTRNSKRNITMIHLAFSLAMRSCEIRRLRLCDVLESDGITLVMTIKLLKTMVKQNKKRNKTRDIPLSNEKARAALQDYIAERRWQAEKLYRNLDLSEPLILSQKGNAFKPNTIVMLFKKLFVMAGFNNAKSHSGRRSCLTLYYRAGMDMKMLQDFAGHEGPRTTMEYIDSDPIKMQEQLGKNIY